VPQERAFLAHAPRRGQQSGSWWPCTGHIGSSTVLCWCIPVSTCSQEHAGSGIGFTVRRVQGREGPDLADWATIPQVLPGDAVTAPPREVPARCSQNRHMSSTTATTSAARSASRSYQVCRPVVGLGVSGVLAVSSVGSTRRRMQTASSSSRGGDGRRHRCHATARTQPSPSPAQPSPAQPSPAQPTPARPTATRRCRLRTIRA